MTQVLTRRSVMTLYSGSTCTYSHMVRLVLAEKGINYEIQEVEENDTPEDLKDLNPYNEVPTLVDRDLVLYAPQVIVEYLDDRFPHPPLMPVAPVSRASNRLMLYRIERDWYSLTKRINVDPRAGKELQDSLIAVSPVFQQKPFFMSDEFSLVDCAILPVLWRLPVYGIELPSQAHALQKYSETMFNRDTFKISLSENEKEMRSNTL